MNRMKPFAGFAVLIAVVGSLAPVAASPSVAQDNPTNALSRVVGPPGAAVAVRGTSCAANASVRIEFDNQLVGTTTSNATRAYHITVHVPVAATPGTHHIWVNTPKCAGWTGGPFVVHTAVSSPGFDARNDGYDPFTSTVPPTSALTNLSQTGKSLPSVDVETAGPVWNITPGSAVYPDYSLVATDGDRLRTYLNTAPTLDPNSVQPTGVNCVEPHGHTFQQLLGSDVATGTVIASVKNGIDAFHLGAKGCTLAWSRAGLSCTCRDGYQQNSGGFAFFPNDPNSIPNVQSLPVWQGFVLTSPTSAPHRVVAISTTAGKENWRLTINGTLASAALIYPQPQLVLGTSAGQVYFVSPKTGLVGSTFSAAKGQSIDSLLTTPAGQVVGKWDSGLVAFTNKGVEDSVALTSPVGDPVINGTDVYVVDGGNNVESCSVDGKGLACPGFNVNIASPPTGRPLLTNTWLGIPTSTGISFLDPGTGNSLGSWVGTPFPVSSIVALDGALLVGTPTGAHWIVPIG